MNLLPLLASPVPSRPPPPPPGTIKMGFPGTSVVKSVPAVEEMRVQLLGWEDPLEKEVVTHSSILAWEIHG